VRSSSLIASIIIRYETELFTDKPTAQPLDVAVVGAGPMTPDDA